MIFEAAKQEIEKQLAIEGVEGEARKEVVIKQEDLDRKK